MGATVEGEHMVFVHLCETFNLAGMEHNDIRPNGTAILEEFEKMTVNGIEGVEEIVEDVRAMVRPMSLESAPANWTTMTIPAVIPFS